MRCFRTVTATCAIILGLILPAGEDPWFPSGLPVGRQGALLLELFTAIDDPAGQAAEPMLGTIRRQARTARLPVLILTWPVEPLAMGNAPPLRDTLALPEALRRLKRYQGLAANDPLIRPQLPDSRLDGALPDRLPDETAPARLARSLAINRPVRLGLRYEHHQALWSVQGAPSGSELLLALVQLEVKQRRPAGELRGRLLVHQALVRQAWVQPVLGDQSGQQLLRLANAPATAELELVAVVQDARMAFLGGAVIPCDVHRTMPDGPDR